MDSKNNDFVFSVEFGFKKVIDAFRERLKIEENQLSKEYIEDLLKYLDKFPALESGIKNLNDLPKYKEPIDLLLDDLFPSVLTENEIKIAMAIPSGPFPEIFLKTTKRFDNILKDAGEDYKLELRNHTKADNYINGCLAILNSYYGFNVDTSRPLYFDIPDENGIVKNYRLAINADFIEFFPTKKAKEIKDEDIDDLIQNLDDIDMWKEKFPPNSWIFRGFFLINLTDVTVDDGISDLKTELLNNQILMDNENLGEDMLEIFRSIYRIPDLEIGFTLFDKNIKEFFKVPKSKISSYLLGDLNSAHYKKVLNRDEREIIFEDSNYLSIPNTAVYLKKHEKSVLAKHLVNAGVKSYIMAPIDKNKRLLGVLELSSTRKNELSNINAIKLEDIIPYIETAVERYQTEHENRIKAVIQSECTSIHPSVLWVFEEEANRYINDLDADGIASFRDISFNNIYPLYGQIDIVGSSDERNNAIQQDLLNQLSAITQIIDEAYEIDAIPIYEQIKFRIEEFSEELHENLNASSEQKIIQFIQSELDPIIDHINDNSTKLRKKVAAYKESIDQETGVVYNYRKNFDDSVQRINRTLARYIDRKQVDAQKIYPHYFERYKTDGVDHNMYIGGEMVKNRPFNKVYLYNLRLWQLQVMCEMENKFYMVQKNAPLQLDGASLILVFSSTLSIRYRMDEKKFDVDGTYNARFEIIKKRIDKAFIKDTEERITQKGKIVIVYSQKEDELEYLRYIKYLQKKNYLGEEVELLELEDVQGVVGLKAIRVNVLYHTSDNQEDNTFTYDDLMKELH
ncbi:GAF domain-containing protein [Mesonia sp. K7]|uniref:GAF domain-containing protein n=1 Tax=Mesonia sp. K7 TaxID=2218606 RepID=UPI000DA9FB82|nr:GAF domain-containing protein [Mesonia sp. K7]PZD79252.1 GAF domain-containing protein [Mesonia sp. K7]